MRKWSIIILSLFLTSTHSFGGWKKRDGNYEFRFDWTNEGQSYWVTFIIPKEEVLRSCDEIKTYNGSWKRGYQIVKEQYTKSQGQPTKKNVEKVRLNWEKFITQDAPFLKGLAEGLKKSAPDKSQRGLAEHALAFVQSIPYSTDFDNKSGYITPIRVLVENKGDCDSKSALMAAIMSEMGIEWKLLYYPTHVLIGVQVPRYQGDSYLPANQDYVLAETTSQGWKLGEWGGEKGKLSEVIGNYKPTPSPTPPNEVPEKEQVTKLIEDAKLSITKKNTALVGAKATLKWLKNINPNQYYKIYSKVSSGEILDLGTFPNPRIPISPTVIWKEETKESEENATQ